MFILRRITSEGNELNEAIGNTYHLVLKERDEVEFNKCLELMEWKEKDEPDLYGFVIYSNHEMVHKPLYKPSMYFIMTSSGQTFANITKR